MGASMIECVCGFGCLTCFALLFSEPMVVSPLSLDDGALCVRTGYTSAAVSNLFAVLLYNAWVGGSLRGCHCCIRNRPRAGIVQRTTSSKYCK